jgi:hypothetical protein
MPTLHEFWDPNEWELHAFGLLQDRHGPTNVMKVPARHKGDFGIDYYCVSKRVAYQCFAVQEPCEVSDRATKQKGKITKDLNKFCTRTEIADLFVGSKVERWILVVPIHDSAQVNLHLSAKTKHVRSLNLPYATPDFEVLVQDLECFDPASVAMRAFHRHQITLPPQPPTAAQVYTWTQASNPLVVDLTRKLVKRIGAGDQSALDAAVQQMVELFLEKENTLDTLRRDSPNLHEALAAVISRHATKLSFYGNPQNATAYHILRYEVDSLTAELKQSIPNFSDASAEQIALGAIAEWLLRCPLDFPPYGHAS